MYANHSLHKKNRALATLYCMKDGDISPIQLQNTQYQVCVALVWRSSEMNVYSWSVTDSQHVM